MRKFNRNQLKTMMLLLMTLDHIDFFLSAEWATFFHALTRCVAVFFGYMLVEGFAYTRSKSTYVLRLFTWAGVMFIGNSLLNHCIVSDSYAVHNNIFLTLAAGGLILYLLDQVKKTPRLLFNGALFLGILLLLAGGAVLTEGGYVVLPFIVLTSLTWKHEKLRDISYLVFAACLFLLFDYAPIANSRNSFEFWMNLGFNSDWLFVTVIPFLHLYSHELGKKSFFNKYLFYVYYPLHLWAISLLAQYLELG